MKKNIKVIIGLVIVIIISGWLISSGRINQFLFQEKTNTLEENIEEETREEIILVINDGQGSPKTFRSSFEEGITAFGLLEEKTKESGLVLETETYDIGVLIKEIGDKENGQDGKYWMYYVNGEMPMVAADKKEIKAGDKIEFKFEKSPF